MCFLSSLSPCRNAMRAFKDLMLSGKNFHAFAFFTATDVAVVKISFSMNLISQNWYTFILMAFGSLSYKNFIAYCKRISNFKYDFWYDKFKGLDIFYSKNKIMINRKFVFMYITWKFVISYKYVILTSWVTK